MTTKIQQDDVYIKFHRSILSRMCRICGFHSSNISSKNTDVKSYATFSVDALKQGVDVSVDHVAVFPTKMCRWCKEQSEDSETSGKNSTPPPKNLFKFVPHGIDCRICKLSCPTCLLTNNPAQHRIKRNLAQEDTEYIDNSHLARHNALQDAVDKFGKEFLNNDQRKKYPEHTEDCELCFNPCFTCGCHPKHDPKAQFIINCPEPTAPVGRMRLRTRKRKLQEAGSDEEEDDEEERDEPIPKQTIIHPLIKKTNGKLCNMYPSIKIKPLELENSTVHNTKQLLNSLKMKSVFNPVKQIVPKPITIAAKTVPSCYPIITTSAAQPLKYRAIQIRSTQPTTSNYTTFKNIGNVPAPISTVNSSPVVLSLTTGPSTLILQNVITGTSTTSTKQEVPILSTGIQDVEGKKYNIKIIPGANNLNNRNDVLMHKINTTKSMMSPIEKVTKPTDATKPAGSIEFGKVPHEVATSFHQIFVSHGSLTAAVKTTLSMRWKLRYKYQFIDREKTKLCVLLGMPTSTDNLNDLHVQLNILDKYVKENHLISRAAAIEELLYSPLAAQKQEKKVLDGMSVEELDSYIQVRRVNEMMKSCSKVIVDDSDKMDTNATETSDSASNAEKKIVRPIDTSHHRHNLRKVIHKTRRFSQSPPRERTETPKNKVLKSVMDQACQGSDIDKILPKLLKHDSHIGCRLTTLIYHSFLPSKSKQLTVFHTCYACGELVKQDRFTQHAWEHFKFNKYSCSNCKLKLMDQAHMKMHVIKRICFKEDVQKERHIPHPKNYTGIIPYFYRPFVVMRQNKFCNLCDYVTKDINLMTFHARQHVGDYPFRCAMCGFASVCKSRLTKHQKTSKHVGFLVIKRSTSPSPQLIKELESTLRQNLVLFNHLGYIEEEAENNRLRKVAENKNKYSKQTSSRQAGEKTNITTASKAAVLFSSSLQNNKGKKIQPRPIKPKTVFLKPVETSSKPASNWTFCEVCNSGFLDKEGFDLHKQECSNTSESNSWSYEQVDQQLKITPNILRKSLLTSKKETNVSTTPSPTSTLLSTKEDKTLPARITSTSNLLGLATKLADRASNSISTTNQNLVCAVNDCVSSISMVARRAPRKQKPQKRLARIVADLANGGITRKNDSRVLESLASCENHDGEINNEILDGMVAGAENIPQEIKSDPDQIKNDDHEIIMTTSDSANPYISDNMEVDLSFETTSVKMDVEEEDVIVNIMRDMIDKVIGETCSVKQM